MLLMDLTDQVSAVVHGHFGPMGYGGFDVFIIGRAVFGPDGVDGNVEIGH